MTGPRAIPDMILSCWLVTPCLSCLSTTCFVLISRLGQWHFSHLVQPVTSEFSSCPVVCSRTETGELWTMSWRYTHFWGNLKKLTFFSCPPPPKKNKSYMIFFRKARSILAPPKIFLFLVKQCNSEKLDLCKTSSLENATHCVCAVFMTDHCVFWGHSLELLYHLCLCCTKVHRRVKGRNIYQVLLYNFARFIDLIQKQALIIIFLKQVNLLYPSLGIWFKFTCLSHIIHRVSFGACFQVWKFDLL